MSQPEINTQRLLLRAFTLSDATKVQNLAGNLNVAKTTLNVPHPYVDGMAEEWISHHLSNWKNETSITYAVIETNSKELIGTVGFVEINKSKAELGYWFGEQHWGKGYCTEATKALIKFAYDNLGIFNVTGEYLSSNSASGRVMEKLGMRRIGSRYAKDRNGERAKLEVYELHIT